MACCLLACAVRECFPALLFCLGLETSPLFICTLETFVMAGMGFLKPTPNSCEIPNSTWGSCSEQQKETGRAELGVDVQRARSSRSGSAGLLPDPVVSQQRGLERSSWLGFSGDVGSVGNERSESGVLFLPPKGIGGVGEGNFFFWLSHISAFLHRSSAGDWAASQPREFPARPPAASKTPS